MHSSSEKGVGKLTLLVFGLLIGAVLYCSYHIMPFYYYYYELQNQMASLIKVASTNTDVEIRRKLGQHMRRMDIPAEVEDVRIERFGEKMTISLEYDEIFEVRYHSEVYYTKVFHFVARAEGQF